MHTPKESSGVRVSLKVSLFLILAAAIVSPLAIEKNSVNVSQPKDARDTNWVFEVHESPAQGESEIESVPSIQQDNSTERAMQGQNNVGKDGSHAQSGSCASQQVLLAFDGSITEEELVSRLMEHGVTATDVQLVSKSLDDNAVLVKVSYEGDEHPEVVAQKLVETDFIETAGADYLETLCEGGEDQSPERGESQMLAVNDTSVDQDKLQAKSNDTYYSQLWGNEAMGASKAWDIAKANGSVTVAVLDSGVDTDHPDLVGNLIMGSYCKATYTGSTGASAVEDYNGHGTHVAGIIAATADNRMGVAGVSYNARILPIKVTIGSTPNMLVSDVIAGIDYVVGLKTNEASPAYLKGIRVINLSLGGYKRDTTGQYQQAINRARNAGILVVAAAGNDAKSALHYPAAYENVVGVSALQKLSTGTYALDGSYSNYGSYVDVAAPGTNIYSTIASGKYGNMTGTSMATPMASGAAALVYAKNAGATPAIVESILEDSADDLGAQGRDDLYGAGAVRVDKAVGAKPIALATIATIPDQLFTGSAVTPEPTVTYSGATLRKGTDYTLSYKNNTAVGTGVVVVTGKGSYMGTQSKAFKIYVLDLADAKIEAIGAQEYTGESINPVPFVTYRGVVLRRDSDYTVEYSNNTKLGTATVRIVGAGAYQGSKSTTFSIVRCDLSRATIAEIPMQDYTGEAITPDVKVSINGMDLVHDRDFTVSYEDNIWLGEAEVVVEGIGNYVGTITASFQITHVLEKPEDGAALTYSGEEQSILPAEADGWYTYEGDIKAVNGGIYTATVKLGHNVYWADGTREDIAFSWRILPRVIAVPTSSGDPDLPYTGLEQQGVPDGEGYELSGDVRATEQGTYTVVATLTSRANYVWEDGSTHAKSIEWAIGPVRYVERPVAIEGLIYNGEEQHGVSEGEGYALTNASSTDAGTYSASATLTPGYRWSDGGDGALTIEWKIARKPIARPVGDTYVYDNTDKAPFVQTPEGVIDPKGRPVQVALGQYHSAAITTSGELYMWGKNANGQLGDGSTTDANVPIRVLGDVAEVSLGSEFSAAVTKSGDLYLWGQGKYGQLGNGSTAGTRVPVKIMSDVLHVSCGVAHAAAITKSGDLYCWGLNNFGQVGDGTTENRSVPKKIMGGVSQVSLGVIHSGAITNNGQLTMWGANAFGEIGDGTKTTRYTPRTVLDGVANIALGNCSSAAILNTGDLYTWGNNQYGQLGDGTTQTRTTPNKVLERVSQVSMSFDDVIGNTGHTAAVMKDGSVYTWGLNRSYQLGDGTTANSLVPKKICADATMVALGSAHSALITSSNVLYVWGADGWGQLGNGQAGYAKTPEELPIRVANGEAFKTERVAGNYQVIVEPSSNYCWEDGSDGEYCVVWAIKPAVVEVPRPAERIYNGSIQRGFEACAGISFSGDTIAKEAGTYGVTASLDRNHVWDDGTNTPKQLTWTIGRKAIALSDVVTSSFAYDGKSHTGVKSGGGSAYAIVDGTTVASTVGTYTATLVITNDNYCWDDGTTEEKVVTWRIIGQDYDMSGISFNDAIFNYDGNTHGIEISGTLPEGVGVTYEGNDQKDIGVYEVTAHFTGDMSSHEPISDMVATMTIQPILVEAPTPASSLTFNGEMQVGLEVPVAGLYRIDGVWEAVDAGVYEAIASLVDKQHYAWDTDEMSSEDLTIRWIISPQSIVEAMVDEIAPVTYNAMPLTPTPVVTLDGKRLSAGRDYTLSFRDNTTAGSATLIVEGMGNYAGTIEMPFTIAPCPLNGAQVSFDADSYEFAHSAIEPSPTVILSDTVLEEERDYEVTYTDNVIPGIATATVTGKGNYTGVATGTFVISEVPTDERVSLGGAMVTLKSGSATYTGQKIEPNITVTLNDQRLIEGLDYLVGYTNNVNAGEARVVITGVGSYVGRREATFVIDPLPIDSMAVSVDDAVCSSEELKPSPRVVNGESLLVEGVDYTVAYEENVLPGTAKAVVSGVGNYSGVKVATFEITWPFKDVGFKTEHIMDICWLAASGVTSGFPDGTFRGMDTVKRCDMAAFLFRMAKRAGVVSDSWQPTAAQAKTFKDISTSTPHYREVLWLASSGISTGFPDGTFRPMGTVVRCDMAAFLQRLAKLEGISTSGYKSFKDVVNKTPHAAEIRWLASSGISTGYPDGTFRPMASVTRQDMAAFLHRLDGLK